MKEIVIIIFCGCTTLSAAAQDSSIEWTGKVKNLNIADQARILEDKHHQYTLDSVVAARMSSKFIPSDRKVLNFRNESIYWIKFSLRNSTSDPLVLVIAQPVLKDITLYFKDSLSGSWQEMKAGFQVPLEQKKFKHPMHAFQLPAQARVFYVRFQPLSLAIPLQVWNENAYEIKISNHRIVYGVFTGMMLFVIVINIFFFFSLHRIEHLHYSLLILLYYLIASNVEGYILYLFPDIDLTRGLNMFAIVAMPVGLTYVLTFLETKKFIPKLNRVVWIIIAFYGTAVLWQFFLTPLQLFYVADVMGLSTVMLMLVISQQAGRRGNKMGYYFFVAYLVFFVIAIVDSINRFTGFPPYIFEISYISFAFMIEAIALSFLLSKRFNWEKEVDIRDKELAQQKLLEQTLENERIVREQNVLLESMVEDRTAQLTDANEELTTLLQTVDQERKKSESLLLNILPDVTARELKELGHAKPQNYQMVSVLFTDFKDFTRLTSGIPPENLVSDLHECFSAFDMIVRKYQVEKIKTIGDAYMAAGGLPIPSGLHALDTVKAALAMRDFMQEWNEKRIKSNQVPFQIRIGIHSGAVVSGVVGTHKFSYDIWGDTVNIASRMESNGEPGKVNISSDTYALIKNYFQCNARGRVAVKGKGELEMFWVEAAIQKS